MTWSIDDIPIKNTSLVSIDVTPLKKAQLSFQTFPSGANKRGEQYDLVFAQVANFDLKVDQLPCSLKSLSMLQDSAFLKNAENDLAKSTTRISSNGLVHCSILFDCGTFDIVAREHFLLKIWSV